MDTPADLSAQRWTALCAIEELEPSAERWSGAPRAVPAPDLRNFADTHLTPKLIRKYCRRNSLHVFLAGGLLRHLLAGCGVCLSALAAAEPPPADVPPTRDPCVALLRTLADPARDRLTPVERFMLRWRLGKDPVAVGWLMFEQCIQLACRDTPKLPQAIAAGIELLAVAAGDLSEVAFRQLYCLSRLYLAKARLEARWYPANVAEGVAKEASEINAVDADGQGEHSELAALVTDVSGKLFLDMGNPEAAARQVELTSMFLCDPIHAEWHGQILSEFALRAGSAGYCLQAREYWNEALSRLDPDSCPLLLLHIHHNMAVNELCIARSEAMTEARMPDYRAVRHHLDASQAFADRYGSDDLRRGRKILEMLSEKATVPTTREALLRECLDLAYAMQKDAVASADALLKTIHALVENGQAADGRGDVRRPRRPPDSPPGSQSGSPPLDGSGAPRTVRS